MKVRIDIYCIIYDESKNCISYKLKIVKSKTFEELCAFDTVIKSHDINRENVTVNGSILKQIINKISILEKYFQNALINESKFLKNMNVFDDTFTWADLEIDDGLPYCSDRCV